MKSCTTCCTKSKPLNFGIPQTTRDGKLEFVEHVLGVLVESRYGSENPYRRLGERNVTTGHSQMFANVRLLTADEIEAHLELPLASANGAWLQDRPGFSPKVAWAKAWEVLLVSNRWLKPTAIPPDRGRFALVQPTSLARGSPTFLGRSSFASFA